MDIEAFAFLLLAAGACLLAVMVGRLLTSKGISIAATGIFLTLAGLLFFAGIPIHRAASPSSGSTSTKPIASSQTTNERVAQFWMSSDKWESSTDAVEKTVKLNFKLEDISKKLAGLFGVGCRFGAPESIWVTLALFNRYRVLDRAKRFSFVSPAADIGFEIVGRTSSTKDFNLVTFRAVADATDSELNDITNLKELLRRIHLNKNFDILINLEDGQAAQISVKSPPSLNETNKKLFEATAAVCRQLQ